MARAEQYLIARKAENRAFWRALAGIGPLDVGGIEYSADLLIPDGVSELILKLEAKADRRRAGVAPAEMERTLSLPRPPTQT
jgi:hypothetical protein